MNVALVLEFMRIQRGRGKRLLTPSGRVPEITALKHGGKTEGQTYFGPKEREETARFDFAFP